MSIKLMSAIWESGPARQSDRFVLLAIADYANDEGECWPSIGGICRKTCLSERGVQTVIRRLENDGWLSIDAGGGRKNCNLYTVKNPAPYAPRTICTPHMDAETPHMDAINPAPAAPEPSLTIIEPSVVKKDVREALCKWASEEAVDSFMAYRKRHKSGTLTLTGAKRLATSLQEIFNAGFDPSDALGMAEERAWSSVQPDWYFKSKGNGSDNRSNNPRTNGTNPKQPGFGSGTVDAFAAVAAQYAEREGRGGGGSGGSY